MSEITYGIRITGDASSATQAFAQTERGADAAAEAVAEVGKTSQSAAPAMEKAFGTAAPASMARLGAATKLTRNELQSLNYTVNDVAASLASGASPMTIFMQQGGQLSQAFGGWGPMFQRIGGLITPLVAGVGLAAGAVGTLALAWHEGREEAAAYADALRLTGNYAGIAASQIGTASAQVAVASRSTLSASREVLQALVSQGQLQGEVLTMAAATVLKVARLSGDSADTVAADFSRMSSGVAKWAEEHNRSYHFISAAQWQHIKDLEDEGRAQEAAKAVLEALNASLDTNQRKLGFFPQLFEDASKAGSRFWEMLKQIGADESVATLETRLANVRRQIEAATKRDALSRGSPQDALLAIQLSPRSGESSAELVAEEKRLQAELAALKKKEADEQAAAQKAADNARVQQAGIAAAQLLERVRLASDPVARANKEIDEYKKAVERVKAAGNLAVPSESEQAKVVAGIRQRNKPQKDAGAVEEANQAYRADIAVQEGLQQREQDSLRRHLDSLDARRRQGAMTEDQFIAERQAAREASIDVQIAIARREADIATAHGKKGDAARYNEEVMRLEQARADLERNAAEEYATLTMRRTGALQQFIVAQRDSVSDQAFERSLIGKSREEVERLTAARRIDLEVRRATVNADGSPKVDAATAGGYAAAAAAAKKRAEDEIRAAEAARGDWTVGASAALRRYLDDAKDVASQTKEVFSSAFRGVEDAVVAWASGAKVNSADVARSMVADLQRILVKQAAVWAYQQMFGGGGQGLSGLGEGLDAISPAIGDAFISVFGFANGGVMTSRGALPLRTYSAGGIANSPQVAVYGEGKRPEAYVPLPDGRTIPVTLAGGGGGANVVVNIHPPAGTEARTNQRQDGDQTVLDVFLEQVDSYLASNVSRGRGALTDAIQSTYGANRSAGAYR